MAHFEGKPDDGDISSEGWDITTAVALSDGFPTGGEIAGIVGDTGSEI